MEFSGPNILNIHAQLLKDFWSRNGIRWSVSPQEWHETIADLQRMGEYKIVYSNPKITMEKHRKEFDKVKNKRSKYRLSHALCLACGTKAQIRHHIIWLKNGGRNNKRNVCFLCKPCHEAVHPWLKNK